METQKNGPLSVLGGDRSGMQLHMHGKKILKKQ